MILGTIYCAKKGCDARHTETHQGAGYPAWGHIAGIADEHGNPPHICPKHMAQLSDYLNTPDKED